MEIINDINYMQLIYIFHIILKSNAPIFIYEHLLII